MATPKNLNSLNKNSILFWLPLCLLIYLLQCVFFYGIGGRDDSYITYWSAYALSEYGEILNFNGSRVEQSSSLLHVLLLSAIYKLTEIPLPELGIWFSLVLSIVTVFLTVHYAKQINIEFPTLLVLLVASSPYFVYWASSGMESSLAAFCSVLLLTQANSLLEKIPERRDYILFAFSAFCFLAVRPENIFIAAMAFSLLFLHILINKAQRFKVYTILKTISIVIILFTIITAWRYIYFGKVFPQPVYAKIGDLSIIEKIGHGTDYFHREILLSSLSLALAFSCTALAFVKYFVKKEKPSNRVVLGIAFILSNITFIFSSGGDWMGFGRFFVPIIPALLVISFTLSKSRVYFYSLFALFIIFTAKDINNMGGRALIGLTPDKAVGYSFYAGILQSETDSTLDEFQPNWTELFNYSHFRDALTVPQLENAIRDSLKKKEKIYIAASQMGMLPYYASKKYFREVEFIDLRGLSTQHFSQCDFVNSSQQHLSSGLIIGVAYYLENLQEMKEQCGIPEADIFYHNKYIDNSSNATSKFFSEYGLVPYYYQDHINQNILPQYIVIKEELLR